VSAVDGLALTSVVVTQPESVPVKAWLSEGPAQTAARAAAAIKSFDMGNILPIKLLIVVFISYSPFKRFVEFGFFLGCCLGRVPRRQSEAEEP
jgi:hypothetical protein